MRHGSFDTASYHFINYAEMGEDESRGIWMLRNDPAVTVWMVNGDEIPFEAHCMFVASLRDRSDKDYFIIKDKDSRIIGSVNLDYSDSGMSERGLFINPLFHRQGHAHRTMLEFYGRAKESWGIRRIKTKVKIGNGASNSLERKLGATLVREDNGYNVYILELI